MQISSVRSCARCTRSDSASTTSKPKPRSILDAKRAPLQSKRSWISAEQDLGSAERLPARPLMARRSPPSGLFFARNLALAGFLATTLNPPLTGRVGPSKDARRRQKPTEIACDRIDRSAHRARRSLLERPAALRVRACVSGRLHRLHLHPFLDLTASRVRDLRGVVNPRPRL